MSKHYSLLRNFRGYRIYLSPQDLAEGAADYFQWVDDHPLLEEKVHFSKDGHVTRADLNKMRPYTIEALCAHLHIPTSRLDSYEKKQDGMWNDVVVAIRSIIRNQKFEGAAAGLLNASLIQRDLGMIDKIENTGSVTVVIEPEDSKL